MIMKDTISKKQLREFGLLTGFGLPIIIGWLLPLLSGDEFREWTLWIAFPVLIIGLITPRLLFYPYKVWIALGHILGWINSHIVLGIIFVLILQPIALIMYLAGYDPLKKKQNKKTTYREDCQNHYTDLNRIF